MPDLLSTLLPLLQSRRLPGLDAGPTAVYPAYDGYSLPNLSASVCQWLGQSTLGAMPLAPAYLESLGKRYQHVIVMLVDGLGLNLFETFLEQTPWRNWLPDSLLAPLTSVSPSTTATALTSLWTGAYPSEHGILGYELWLKEYGLIANMIQHSPAAFNGDVGGLQRASFDPANFLPTPRLGQHLSTGGVDVFALQPAAIARSGLSTMLLTGAEVVGYRNLSDLWVTLDHLLQRQRGRTTYATVYWSDVDELSHRFGPQDERVVLEFETFSRTLQNFVFRLQKRAQGDTLLVMLADHGQIHTPLNPRYELHRYPDLLADLVMAPSGENRLPYFFLRPGRAEHARAVIQKTWPDEFLIVASEAALSAGLFGPGQSYARTPERLGDWVLIPQGGTYMWWANKENPLHGRHGGLSPQEMLVPFWAMEI
ncbi:MAG: alkaline phosphatase family protein [Bellilinea sp.]